MSLKQHTALDERFRQQVLNAEEYLLPFIEEAVPITSGMKVLEIGAAEGGVLKPFVDRGCWCLGVDLAQRRIDVARQMMREAIETGQARFETINVYDAAFQSEWDGVFDLILLKDTIEHIPDQERFIPYITRFLAPGGRIFFGFPPWRMPFGGHQQICRSRILGFLPYFHLLPRPVYRALLKAAHEPEGTIGELMSIKSTGISLARFERIVTQSNLHIELKRLFLFNPIYRFKFGLQPRVQFRPLAMLPILRDFVTTAGWYLVAQPPNTT